MLGQAFAAIAVALLGASGVAKLLDPDPTTGALAVSGLPSNDAVSRLLGVVEIAVAIGASAVGGVWLGLGAVLYLGFALFTVNALRRDLPIQSCGCFGREDTPPTSTHVVYNGLAATALIWSAAGAGTIVPWDAATFEVAAYLMFTVLGAVASYLVLSRLAQLKELITT